MNLSLRFFARLAISKPFLSTPQFHFSQQFEKQDLKQLSESHFTHYRKQFLHYKMTANWKRPLEKKQKRNQRRLEIASSKIKPQVNVEKLVVHNAAVGIEYPPKLDQIFAVIQVDGFQYKVYQDALIMLDTKKDYQINQSIFFKQVPLIGSKTFTLLGRPHIQTAYVEAIIESISDSKKVIVFKKQRRKNYKRSFGSRISLTQCRIKRIAYQITAEVLNTAIPLQ